MRLTRHNLRGEVLEYVVVFLLRSRRFVVLDMGL
jgi:hypothetical protein